MTPTTRNIVLAALRGDPTISPQERARLMAGLKPGHSPANAFELSDRIISRRETASILGGRTLRWVDSLVTRGILQKVKLPGAQRAIGFRASEVSALVEAQVRTEDGREV